MTKDEALNLALKVLEAIYYGMGARPRVQYAAITAIQEALAQPDHIEAVLTMVRPAQEPWLLESTQTLAKTLARKFYPEVTQWKCLNDLAGVILQIENMTTGLMRKSEQDWEGIAADQAMTIALLKSEQEPLEYWNAVEGWVKIDEVRKHFDSVGCGTIYKTAGEDRTPLYTSPPAREWVGLNWGDLPEEWVGDTKFLTGARWAEEILEKKNA